MSNDYTISEKKRHLPERVLMMRKKLKKNEKKVLTFSGRWCRILIVQGNTKTVKHKNNQAGMAELADAHGSGPCGSNTMRVQVSFPARIREC